MKKRIKNQILAVLLAAVLAAGNISPAVLAASDRVAAETVEQEPEEGAEEEMPMPEEGAGEEMPVPEEGVGEEMPALGEGTEEETPMPEEGTEGEMPGPGEGTEEETSAPEEGTEEETPGPEEGTGEEMPEPEEGAEEEMPVPEEGAGEETPEPEEAGIMDELLNSGLLEEIPEQLLEEAEAEPDLEACTCGSEEQDALLHAWDCPVFQSAFLELCDCGEESKTLTDHAFGCSGVLKAFAALCNDECRAYENPAAAHRCEVQKRLKEALCTCSSDSDDFSEHDEACGYYQYLLESVNEMYGVSLTDVYNPPNRKQNGYPLTDTAHVSGWTFKDPSSLHSSSYKPILFRPGISSMSLWVDDGANVKTWTRTIGNYKCMHPADSSVKTKKHFGALYSKVVYDGAKWYDMKITVVDYSDSVTSNSGTKVTARPGITFATDRIAFQTSQKVGAVRVRVEFFETGTSTSANLNLRFQWRDIDDSQRFGFALGDGSVAARYYYSKNTTVNCSKNKDIAGMNMEVMVGHWEHSPDETAKETRIAYELNNCSRFYIGFGPEDNIGNADRQIVYTTEFYREGEKALKAGKDEVVADRDGDGNKETTTTINDLLVVTDATAVIETPAPIKRVSNSFAAISPEGYASWPTSNTLSATTGEYYYMIRQEVPWQDAEYRYESFSVRDNLPAGADYVSLTGITDEGGNNKSGLFSVSGAGDAVTITAKNPSESSFAGHWYTFIFKVKMDPTEITPTYSGNSAVYEIRNTASVISKNAGSSQTSKNTNEVITKASSIRPTQENPQKGINRNISLTEHTVKSVSEEIVFSIFQKVPAYDASWEPCTITMTDKLEDCLQYTGSTVHLDGAALPDGWAISASGQTVTATGANKSNYGGKTLRFDITCRVKDGYDLSSYQKMEDGDIAAVIPNKAKVKFAWSHAAASIVEKETNTVHVKVKETAVNLLIHKTSADTAEPVPGAAFTVYEWDGNAYSINRGTMSYHASEKIYRMDQLIRTDTNAGKFKVKETGVPYGYTGSWEKEFTIGEVPGGGTKDLIYNVTNELQKCRIIIQKENEAGERLKGAVFEISAAEDILSPQGTILLKEGTVVETVTADKDGIAVSKDLYTGNYLVNETKAPAGYDIGETAFGVMFNYAPGQKDAEIKETVLNVTNPMKKAHLKLTKEIDTADIVWAHGNPTFTFKVEGTDLCGSSHKYYETVEFTRDNIGNGEKAVLTAEFTMPSGTYQASEEKTMRYRLDHIHSISGGKLQGEDAVIFDLSQGNDGAAVFYNEKTTDENLSHTVFVRNVIQE